MFHLLLPPTDWLDWILWAVLPYAALALFWGQNIRRFRRPYPPGPPSPDVVLGRRYRRGAIVFHYGLAMTMLGHVFGLLVPARWTAALGISDSVYHVFSTAAGSVAGLMVLGGFSMLAWRRFRIKQWRDLRSKHDVAVYLILGSVIVLGCAETLGWGVAAGGYDYRETVSVWYRSILIFQPQPEMMADVPLVFQLHALVAWILIGFWGFTRLHHAFAIPTGHALGAYRKLRNRGSQTPEMP